MSDAGDIADDFGFRFVETDADFLISLAQNEYMIDQYYLPTGLRLMSIAYHGLDGDGTVEGCPCCFGPQA